MLDEPAYGVARGQAAVLYDGDVVVGSGLVTSAERGCTRP
ncbi:MAG: aminomethyltransferase beta-barrel domain-containing protein [Gaiellaceae bacterium]